MRGAYPYTSSGAYSYSYSHPCASNCDSLSYVYPVPHLYASAHSYLNAAAACNTVPYVYSLSNFHPVSYIHADLNTNANTYRDTDAIP